MEPRKLIRITLREEFVALTGDHTKALLLQQCLYWTESHNDFDDYIREEERRKDTGLSKTYGWFQKSLQHIADQTLLLSKATVSRHLQALINSGWLECRQDTIEKDRLQYRVNLIKLQQDLQNKGYPLDGYTLISGKGGMTEGKQCSVDGQGVRYTDRIHKTSRFKTENNVSKWKTVSQNGTAISKDIVKSTEDGTGIPVPDVNEDRESNATLSSFSGVRNRELQRQGTNFTGDVSGLEAEVYGQVRITAPQVIDENFRHAFVDLVQEQAIWENSHHVKPRTPRDEYTFQLNRFLKRYRSKRLLFYDLNFVSICHCCGIPCIRSLDTKEHCQKEERLVSATINKLVNANSGWGHYISWLQEKAEDKGWTVTPALVLKPDLVDEFLVSWLNIRRS